MPAPYENQNASGKRVKRDRVAINLSVSERNGLLALFAQYLFEQGKNPMDDLEIKRQASKWAYQDWKQRLSRQYQEIEVRLAHVERERDGLKIDLEVEKEYSARLVGDWNAMCHMLDHVLGVQVYSDEIVRDDQGNRAAFWTIEYNGKVSKGHATVAGAYETVLRERQNASSPEA